MLGGAEPNSLSVWFSLRTSDVRGPPAKDDDEDVARERQRIREGGSKNDILLIRDLYKVKAVGFCYKLTTLKLQTQMLTLFLHLNLLANQHVAH